MNELTGALLFFVVIVGLIVLGVRLLQGVAWTVRRIWGDEGVNWFFGPWSRLFLAIWGGGLAWAAFDHMVPAIIGAIIGWVLGAHIDRKDRQADRRDRALALLRKGPLTQLTKEDRSELIRITAHMRDPEELRAVFGGLSHEELRRVANMEE